VTTGRRFSTATRSLRAIAATGRRCAMARINATLKIDGAAIARQGLDKLIAPHGPSGPSGIMGRSRDAVPAWNRVRGYLFKAEADLFAKDGRADGYDEWAPVGAPVYKAWKSKWYPGHRALRLTLRLWRQLTGKSGDHYEKRQPQTFTFGTNYPVAGSSGQRSSWDTPGVLGSVLPFGERWSLDVPNEDVGGLHAEGGFIHQDSPTRFLNVEARSPIRITDMDSVRISEILEDWILDGKT